MQFKFLNRCGMGLDVESQRLLSLITFKDWGKKHFEVQNKKSCVWLGVFFYHYDYHHHFFKKSDCEITGIPANHLVSLVWPLTDSCPCQSAFGFATFGSLSLCLSLSVSHKLPLQTRVACSSRSLRPLPSRRGLGSGPRALAAQRLRRAAPLSDSLSPSP